MFCFESYDYELNLLLHDKNMLVNTDYIFNEPLLGEPSMVLFENRSLSQKRFGAQAVSLKQNYFFDLLSLHRFLIITGPLTT